MVIPLPSGIPLPHFTRRLARRQSASPPPPPHSNTGAPWPNPDYFILAVRAAPFRLADQLRDGRRHSEPDPRIKESPTSDPRAIFLHLIKMIIAPLIFLTCCGHRPLGDTSARAVGSQAVGWFLCQHRLAHLASSCDLFHRRGTRLPIPQSTRERSRRPFRLRRRPISAPHLLPGMMIAARPATTPPYVISPYFVGVAITGGGEKAAPSPGVILVA